MTVRTTVLQGVSKAAVKVAPFLLVLGILVASGLCIHSYSSTRFKRYSRNPAIQEATFSPHKHRNIQGQGEIYFNNSGNGIFVQPSAIRPDWSSLLLVTMGRSGSTFTSAIISHHKDVFYASEPLHAVEKDIYNEVISPETAEKSQNVVDAFLTCDFRKMDAYLFRSELFLNSKSTENIYDCLRNKNNRSYDYVACFIAMWRECSNKRLHFVKTIRYRLQWVKGAMQRNPGLKVLYLVRDFRATLYSQASAFETFNITTDGERRAKAMCTGVENNALQLETLFKLFPGRIRVIRYEDGCLYPVNYAKNMYAFAGLQFSDATERFVRDITQSRKSQKVVSDKFKVERSDAVRTMNRWRSSASFDLVRKIDRMCVKANAIFGYKPVKSLVELETYHYSLVSKPGLRKGLYQSVLN